MDYFATWFGVGVKGGGTLGLAGFEATEGYISNLGLTSHSHSINISSLRLGAGLGAGVGLCAIYVFNCRNPQNLHEKNDSSWSVNVALGGKWDGIVKFLANSKLFDIAPKFVNGIGKATNYDLDSLRNIGSNLYTMYEVREYSKDKVVVIDIPFAGAGLELSAQKLYGTIYIGDLRMMKQNLDKSGLPSGAKRVGEL